MVCRGEGVLQHGALGRCGHCGDLCVAYVEDVGSGARTGGGRGAEGDAQTVADPIWPGGRYAGAADDHAGGESSGSVSGHYDIESSGVFTAGYS